MSPILSSLSESGKSFNKKHNRQEQKLNSSQRYISSWNTKKVYRQLLDSLLCKHFRIRWYIQIKY